MCLPSLYLLTSLTLPYFTNASTWHPCQIGLHELTWSEAYVDHIFFYWSTLIWKIYQHGIQKRRFGRWCSFSIGWFFRFQFQFRSFSRELLASGSFWRQTGLEGGIFAWIVITFCPTKAMPKHHRTSLCRFHSFPVYSNMSCGEFALQIVFTAFHSRSAIPNTHFWASKSFPCTLYTYIIRDFQCNSWSKSWHVSNCNAAAIKSLAIGFQLFIWNLWTQGTKTEQWQHSIKKCS